MQPNTQFARDAMKGARLLSAVPADVHVTAAIVVRENVIAINIGEPLQAFIERSEQLVQWGDRRQGGKRNRTLALVSTEPADPTVLKSLSDTKIAGVVLVTPSRNSGSPVAEPVGAQDALDEMIEIANTHAFFVSIFA